MAYLVQGVLRWVCKCCWQDLGLRHARSRWRRPSTCRRRSSSSRTDDSSCRRSETRSSTPWARSRTTVQAQSDSNHGRIGIDQGIKSTPVKIFLLPKRNWVLNGVWAGYGIIEVVVIRPMMKRALLTSDVNKVQRSVLSTSWDGRTVDNTYRVTQKS